MPANVESMFSVRQMPWHREGTILDDYPGDWDQARKLAGLDWDPVTTQVYALADLHADGTPRYEPIDGWKCIARSDNGAVLSLNRDTYTVISHGEMGEIVEAVLAQTNVKRETAGVLDGGRAVWCLALLDEPISLPGDASPTLPYLAITNRHDGTGSCALRATAVRIVCANTFRAAELEGERTGATFSFIHKSSWRNRIEEARQAVTGARAEMRRYTELAHQLLGIPITPRQRELFVTQFIPIPPQGLVTDRVARNIDEARNALRLLFQSTTNEQIAGTGYGLVQAAGEYLDHVRTARSWETRLNRTLIRPEPLKHRALSLVREIAARDDFHLWEAQLAATGHCASPIRLAGRIDAIDRATGQARVIYDTDSEPGGVLRIACGNRREHVCAACSAVYKNDARQIIRSGLTGGKGIPGTVATHPCVFATLTAPGFGPVHTTRTDRRGRKLPCRPRRDASQRRCPHGRDISCSRIHRDDDPRLGQPMCPDCYDYTGHVLFNACGPDLWRRFTIYLPPGRTTQPGPVLPPDLRPQEDPRNQGPPPAAHHCLAPQETARTAP